VRVALAQSACAWLIVSGCVSSEALQFAARIGASLPVCVCAAGVEVALDAIALLLLLLLLLLVALSIGATSQVAPGRLRFCKAGACPPLRRGSMLRVRCGYAICAWSQRWQGGWMYGDVCLTAYASPC
jgi:hypothetical protein